jgi:hypothetical protein
MTGLAVFFPALMGAGILVSGVLLLSDAVRRLMPIQGMRRRHRNAVGTFGIVAAVARTAGLRIDQPSYLTRRARSRVAYLAIAGGSVCLSAISLSAGLDAYGDPLSVFSGSPWVIGIVAATSAALVLIALASLALVVLASSDLPAVRWIVEHSPLGRLAAPESAVVGAQTRKDGS